ncbi:MAG: PD40 domain-containing protein [Deltaproteobacteria bacterium]|nr:PD40 domain-containing protein [Deltaproteobacteria bacterium]
MSKLVRGGGRAATCAWRSLMLVAGLTWQVSAVSAGIFQVTNGGFNSGPTISGDGRYVVFGSSYNPGGVNPFGFNVLRYDMLLNKFTAITSDGASDPVISTNGRYIAFTSSADYTKRNADGSDDIFRYDTKHRHFQQLTRDKNGDGSSELAAISGDGKRVAFETTSNLRGRNSDFSNEVYLFNRSGNIALSVDPNGDGESHTPALSGDGTVVAFVSTSDLTGHNADFSQELFVYDVTQHDLSQITIDNNGDGETDLPQVSGDGRFITFISSSNVGGLNPDFASAIYLRNRTGYLTIVTATPSGPFDGDAPTINDDGKWIAFLAGYDITGGNPDHNGEILLYNRTRKTFTQVTDSAGCANIAPKLSGDGSRITFQSGCNYNGGNPDHSLEVWVADNPALNMTVHAEGPVDLVITDPDGNSINKNSSSIPNATYVQGDFDNDMIGEVRITIPRAIEGRYLISLAATPGALPTDAVTVDGTLNDSNVELASGTVADLNGTQLSFGNQTFVRRLARMTPIAGVGSRVYLSARMTHAKSHTGPMRIRFDDGSDQQVFDFGQVQNLGSYGTFKGIVDNFYTKLRVAGRPDGSTSVSLTAKDGDLSQFIGSDNLSMTMSIQIGPDTDMFNWRFKRDAITGKLVLK